ncbi:membrane-associated protease RseP (regulator of RpoE activity) [Streptosporangium album]|uniref:Membrane-associated protease RseP (Regulator of RpoE activity) n=1 Tax=Streptosporangium album TaxID=47479 RepID=A0A7W7W7U9_9ACTN|nr:M50 family metallopeptidase [Streptosporangium album]MBB4936419.1 membrane-associated protease RseP (regulator of RpoE activity) [Streptosporangium album]
MSWLFLIGVIVFALGLVVSIGLHEIGHLVPAKRFGVKVTQYMIGFGPTMWSWRRGETEYGVKWIPFGGYIRMIGMLPPRPTDDPNKVRSAATGPWQGLIENAREVALEEVQPGDEGRVFYRKPWWQKVIIMSGGPAMNFVLAFIIFAIVIMGFGVPVLKPVVSGMTKCVIPYSESLKPGRVCTPADPPTPAAQAGVKPGDTIVAFNGVPVSSWEEATKKIRANGAGPIALGIVRDGKPQTLNVTLISQDRPVVDDPEKIEKNVGFLGVAPTQVIERQNIGYVVGHMVDLTGRVAESMVNLPQKMVGVWNAAFSGDERDPNGPVGVVGAGRIGGEIAASSAPAENKFVALLSLLAGFNLAIGMFNLIPLLPLDGGHVAGGLWEGIKRAFARVTRRPEPAHVDIAKVLPLTYALAFTMMILFGLLLYADLVNPIRLTG